MIKRLILMIVSICLCITTLGVGVNAYSIEQISDTDMENQDNDISASGENLDLSAKSGILIEAETGTVLYSKNASEALPPASVTKIMTLLLVAEAIDEGAIKLDQKVIVSKNAASMGGSQIFIKEGEEFTVEDLLKSTIIASANDAAIALAELLCGTEQAFVGKMNERARELGMKNTFFENATGLDDSVEKHLTSAYDIALMSRELIKHELILNYSTIWQDEIRGGEFILTNTNRLVRYYQGCTGLKTGSTDKAGFCISATAKRDGMHLIAVVMGAPTRDERNNSARAMLDYGFANYAVYSDKESDLESVPIKRGRTKESIVYNKDFSILIHKSDISKIEKKYNIPEAIIAPCEMGATVGDVTYLLDGAEIGKTDICIREQVERISLFDIIALILGSIFVDSTQ